MGGNVLMKKWYYSKTVWINFLAFAAVVAQTVTGKEVIDPATQTMIITVINLILRKFTKHELS
jgi:hypothetical protein